MKLQFFFNFLFLLTPALSPEIASAAPHFGDSATALVKQTIVSRLHIRKISDLNFGEASPGDGPKIIPAGTSETRENASFEINGEALRPFQIILPARNSVKMINGVGGHNREIMVQEFSSTPSQSGVLDANGRTMVFVGATRQAISPNQKTGDYTGQFYVTVVY
jgi:hypothetical protein